MGTPDEGEPPTYDAYLEAVLELWERGINPMIEKRIVPIPADKSRPEPLVVVMARMLPKIKADREIELKAMLDDPACMKEIL